MTMPKPGAFADLVTHGPFADLLGKQPPKVAAEPRKPTSEPPVNLKDKKLLVMDFGLFTEAAVRLARDFGKVWICRPDEGGFPRLNEGMVGAGMENVEIVHHPWKYAHKADMVATFDLYLGDFCQECVRQNIPTWSALRGEDLEIERTATQREQQKRGLPTAPFERVVGVKALREYLKAHKNVWVKVERWRGVRESFQAESLEAVEPILRDIEHEQGPLAEDIPFMIVGDLPDRVEFGMDTFIVKGEHPKMGCGGIEIKDCGYLGLAQPWDKFPEPLTRWFKVMQPVLATYGYRGWLSTETRIGKDMKPFNIDITARMPAPPFELVIEWMKNFPEVVWSVAHGEMIEPEFEAKFGAAIIIKTSSPKSFQRVIFPPTDRKHIKLRYPCKREGIYQSIPQTVSVSETATAIAWAGTHREALLKAQDIAGHVKGCDLSPCEDVTRKALEQIEKGKAMGLQIF